MNTQEHKETAHHIALQTEELGNQPGLDIVINPDMPFKRVDYNIEVGSGSDQPAITMTYDDKREKPIYTQAMADAGELPPIGYVGFMLRDSKDLTVSVQWEKGDKIEIIAHVDGDNYSTGVAAVANNMTRQEVNTISSRVLLSKTPIQTDEEKLRDALCEFLEDVYIDEILASGKFTISLNKE